MIRAVTLAAICLATFATAWQHHDTVVTDGDSQRKYDYALVYKDGSVHCFGSWNSDDLKAINAGTKDDRLIVQKDHKLYAITDRQTIDAVKKELEPMMELGRQQGALGKKQGELGKKQGEIGRQQGVIGRKQGEASREFSQAARDKNGAPDSEASKAFHEKMSALSSQMSELGGKMGELGKQMGGLGKQMGELGRKMGEASRKADKAITEILDRAFDKGLAKEVR